MQLISDLWAQFLAFCVAHYWYKGLAWLALWYLLLVWPLAAVGARAITTLDRGRSPIEWSVYVAWAFAFIVHVCLWVWLGLDAIAITWHWGAPGDPGYWMPATGPQYFISFMAIVPYLLVVVLDVVLVIRLSMAASRVRSAG